MIQLHTQDAPACASTPSPVLRASFAFPGSMAKPRELKLFDEDGPCLGAIQRRLERGAISDEAAIRLLDGARDAAAAEPNVVPVFNQDGPITVVGDLHGQFADLLKLMETEGLPSHDRTVVFLGDYVDRGDCSTEVLLYLCACKVLFPANVVLLRGNHETKGMCDRDGFAEECEIKYSQKVLAAAFSLFRALPLGCLIVGTPHGDCFCCHGGIGPSVSTLQDIDEIDRFVDVPECEAMTDLLWADPMADDCDDEDAAMDCEDGAGFTPNTSRRTSWFFSAGAVESFLRRNELVCIIRGHQAQQDGYRWHFADGVTVPRVLTVFSSPNYCGRCGNLGALLRIDADCGFEVQQFSSCDA